MRETLKRFLFGTTITVAIVLNGCGGSPEPDSAPNEAATPPAQSAAPETSPSPAPVDPHAGLAMPKAIESASPLQWSAPEGWVQAPDRMMRAVTFTSGADNQMECYVSVLGGDGGGLASNLNRWRTQMAQEPLDDAAIASLEKIDVLGQPSPFIEINGDYSGMNTPTMPGYTMYGVVTLLSDQSIFIKMTGPAADMPAQKDNFIAFCKSLRKSQ